MAHVHDDDCFKYKDSVYFNKILDGCVSYGKLFITYYDKVI